MHMKRSSHAIYGFHHQLLCQFQHCYSPCSLPYCHTYAARLPCRTDKARQANLGCCPVPLHGPNMLGCGPLSGGQVAALHIHLQTPSCTSHAVPHVPAVMLACPEDCYLVSKFTPDCAPRSPSSAEHRGGNPQLHPGGTGGFHGHGFCRAASKHACVLYCHA